MTTPLIIAVSASLILTNTPFKCGDNFQADGCYDGEKNVITINTAVSDEGLRFILLHEFAHAKYNKNRFVEVFDVAPENIENKQQNALERMADWFTIFWNNPENFKILHPNWAAFFEIFGI